MLLKQDGEWWGRDDQLGGMTQCKGSEAGVRREGGSSKRGGRCWVREVCTRTISVRRGVGRGGGGEWGQGHSVVVVQFFVVVVVGGRK